MNQIGKNFYRCNCNLLMVLQWGLLAQQYSADQERADYSQLKLLAPPNFFTIRHHCININTMDQKRGRNVRLKANGIFRGRQQTRMARRWLVYIPALDIAWSTKLHCTFLILVFCYQNCSDLLWEKNVLLIEKNFWNSRLKAEKFQKFWDY